MKLLNVISKKFTPALAGIKIMFSDRSFQTQLFLAFLAIVTSLLFNFNLYEWFYVIMAIGMILMLEMLNTALEETVNYISPIKHPQAKKIKDIAAGAVLLMSIVVVIGYLLILRGKL